MNTLLAVPLVIDIMWGFAHACAWLSAIPSSSPTALHCAGSRCVSCTTRGCHGCDCIIVVSSFSGMGQCARRGFIRGSNAWFAHLPTMLLWYRLTKEIKNKHMKQSRKSPQHLHLQPSQCYPKEFGRGRPSWPA
jgi:hypothetical protein